MHTSSCGSMPSSHRKRSACGESRVRYWRVSVDVWGNEGRVYRYPMIALGQKTAAHNQVSRWSLNAASQNHDNCPETVFANESLLLLPTKNSCVARKTGGSRAPQYSFEGVQVEDRVREVVPRSQCREGRAVVSIWML